MRHKPEPYGYRPDGEAEPAADGRDRSADAAAEFIVTDFTTRKALKTRAFWMLSFTFLFQHLATSAVMVHIVPYLESVNVPKWISAFSVTGMTTCSLIGRMGFGFLGDFTNKRHLVALCFLLQSTGVVVFSFIDETRVWLIIPFLLLYAPGYGGPIPLRPALQADYFGTSHFGAIMGIMALVGLCGGLFSPVFAGWIFDVTGSYIMAWRVLALTVLPGIPLILLSKPTGSGKSDRKR
jgi:cyanate permease